MYDFVDEEFIIISSEPLLIKVVTDEEEITIRGSAN